MVTPRCASADRCPGRLPPHSKAAEEGYGWASVISARRRDPLSAPTRGCASPPDESRSIRGAVSARATLDQAQTFAQPHRRDGFDDRRADVHSDLDEMRIVGLVERDWPEPARRSIFYPSSILSHLGWPADASRNASSRAEFHDLLRSASARVSTSLFTLEDDAIVSPSALLEELEMAGLPIERWPEVPPGRAFLHENIETPRRGGTRRRLAGCAPRGRQTRPRSRGPPARGPRPRHQFLDRYCCRQYLRHQVLTKEGARGSGLDADRARPFSTTFSNILHRMRRQGAAQSRETTGDA